MSVVLFVDDDVTSTRALVRSIERHCSELESNISFEIISANNGELALRLAKEHSPEVAVVDLTLDETLGPESGLSLVSQLIKQDPTMRVLVLTGHGADRFGVRALHHGAASFLEKPVDVPHLLALIQDSTSYAKLRRNYALLQNDQNTLVARVGINARSPKMMGVLEDVVYASSTNQPVLICGETGTGKGVIAQAIHRTSNRRSRPFIRFQPNFGGQDLVSSEIFGHVRGAFTGAADNRTGLIEEANRGTLFIDEVDELPKETQVLLLNVLQERVFRKLGSNKEQKSDFRLIAATNQQIEKALSDEKLREDFYHRIAHFTIKIPPLRERKEDIPLLAENFLSELANRENLAVHGFTPQAVSTLHSHHWPGNVRELLAVVEGGVYKASFKNRRLVEPEDLQLSQERGVAAKTRGSFRDRVQAFEIEVIREALINNENNQTLAAKTLDMDRTSLRRILNRSK